MNHIKIKKSWNFKIAGKPSRQLISRPPESSVASVPDIIPFVKPRLRVKEGDHVKIGSVLFEDKKHPDYKFVSPGGGIVSAIHYGKRRALKEIVITLDDDEKFTVFDSVNRAALKEMDKNTIISILMAGGMWPLIRQLPFRGIADPEKESYATWVMLGSSDPFQPSPYVYLKDQSDFFRFGIDILQKISRYVHICFYGSEKMPDEQLDKMISHRISGGFPASDPGVVVYHTKKIAIENNAWYVDGQDVIGIGKFFMTGTYPVERIVALSDGSDESSCHLKTRTGVKFDNLYTANHDRRDKKWIAGGIFTGHAVDSENYLGLYETSVMIVDEARQSEFFGFLQPGLRKLSNSRTVLSAMLSDPLKIVSGMNGETRPCINCGYCANICPVDILPQFTYKCIYADEIEEALTHGLLDCVECGLCSFVCPSKIELSETLIGAKHSYCKETE